MDAFQCIFLIILSYFSILHFNVCKFCYLVLEDSDNEFVPGKAKFHLVQTSSFVHTDHSLLRDTVQAKTKMVSKI